MATKTRTHAANIVYEALKNDIINNKYEGGTFLVETQLSEEFKVSRTPVREALLRLSQEGYLEMVPNKGTYIPHITINDIVELCEIRAALEGMAAYLCASQQTEIIVKLLEESISREEAMLNDSNTLPSEISAEDLYFHQLIARGCNSNRLQKNIELIHNQMQRFLVSSADSLAAETTLNVSLGFHKKIVSAIKENDSEKAQSEMTAHWLEMGKGYIQRNLMGKLNAKL